MMQSIYFIYFGMAFAFIVEALIWWWSKSNDSAWFN